jgi:hypothetical protein
MTGPLRSSSYAALFAALAFVRGVASCGKGPDEGDAEAGCTISAYPDVHESPNKRPLWRPDTVLVLIPDIAGYFRDCNCAGENIGGLERVPFAANVESPSILFYGPTIFATHPDTVQVLTPPDHRRAVFLAASRLWSSIGRVRWLPATSELEELTANFAGDDSPMDAFLHGDGTALAEGIEVQVSGDKSFVTVTVGGRSYRMQGPMRRASGREVLCVAVWRQRGSAEGAKDGIVFSRTAGILASRKPDEGTPAAERLSIELSKAPTVVSTWRVFLGSDTPSSSRYATAIDAYEFDIMHGASAPKKPRGQTSASSEGMSACASCHPKAVASWLDSAHSHALATLREKRQDKNPACLPCHTTPELATPVGKASQGPHTGVSCRSCHTTKGARPTLETCEGCHTTHADPERWYAQKFSGICPGDVVRLSEVSKCACE